MPERQGPGRRVEDCEKCAEHTGMVEKDNNMLTWIKAIFAVVTFASGLMAYSVMWQAPNITLSIVRIENRMDGLKDKLESADLLLDKRVTCLEDAVYNKKPGDKR